MLFKSSNLVLLLLTFCTEGSIIRREDSDYDLTILHTNDVHSRYDQSNKYGTDCTKAQIENKQCYGGLARLKTAIDQLREKHPNNLLLDGGDEFQGTMYYTYYKGDITARAMNYLKYDVMTIGNHEFDNGPDNLARVAQNFTFPLVSSNIDASQHPQLSSLIKKYQLFPKYNLAVVGYITYTAPSISSIGKLLKVSDPIITLQETIDEVKKMGYKRVIAVSHNGLSLIVGGHSHSYLASPLNNVTNAPNSMGLYPTSVKNLDGKDTYIVQAYCWSRFLGHVDIKFNEDGYLSKIDGFPIELNSLVPLNEEANKQAQEWREPFDAFGKTVLGIAADDFEQASCQTKECSLGSFVSDIILEKRPNSDVSFLNAGVIRAGITKGDIKVSDVLTVFPFGNAIVDIKLTGQQLWDMLEAIVSKVNKVNNRPVSSFIQIGGMRFTYDPTAPEQSRLVSVDILNRKTKTATYVKLDLEKVYTCTTLDFVATGGDNFIAPPVTDFAPLDAIDVIVSDYIKKYTPVSPYTDGRIKIVKK
ncbi:Metallo-dependent phosphatase, partial [Neoconidiobolus thromboides FSU 785]